MRLLGYWMFTTKWTFNSGVRIPSNAAGCSEGIGPGIPGEGGQLFRVKRASESGGLGPLVGA